MAVGDSGAETAVGSMSQARLIELFDEFGPARRATQWPRQEAMYKALLFCLYELIQAQGPTQECEARLGQGFDHSISP